MRGREVFFAQALTARALVKLMPPPITPPTMGASLIKDLLNRRQDSARRGLIVSGLAGTGKTTAITQMGKTSSRSPAAESYGDGLILVVRLSLDPRM